MGEGCGGGIAGRVTTADKILAPKTTIYDIHEGMGDPAEADEKYATRRLRRPLIIRAVSDLVSPVEGEVTGNLALFRSRAADAMHSLLGDLRILVPFLAARLNP